MVHHHWRHVRVEKPSEAGSPELSRCVVWHHRMTVLYPCATWYADPCRSQPPWCGSSPPSSPRPAAALPPPPPPCFLVAGVGAAPIRVAPPRASKRTRSASSRARVLHRQARRRRRFDRRRARVAGSPAQWFHAVADALGGSTLGSRFRRSRPRTGRCARPRPPTDFVTAWRRRAGPTAPRPPLGSLGAAARAHRPSPRPAPPHPPPPPTTSRRSSRAIRHPSRPPSRRPAPLPAAATRLHRRRAADRRCSLGVAAAASHPSPSRVTRRRLARSSDDEDDGEHEVVAAVDRVCSRASSSPSPRRNRPARARVRARARAPPRGRSATAFAPAFASSSPTSPPTSIADLSRHFAVTDVRGGGVALRH